MTTEISLIGKMDGKPNLDSLENISTLVNPRKTEECHLDDKHPDLYKLIKHIKETSLLETEISMLESGLSELYLRPGLSQPILAGSPILIRLVDGEAISIFGFNKNTGIHIRRTKS